ncbi:MAG: hypothetical protein HYT87_18095 [Nitrospirae bacterium]|nr:hypothetical protein [Nitrospirota bacterium]
MPKSMQFSPSVRVLVLLLTAYGSLLTLSACGDPFSRGEAKEEVVVNGTVAAPEGVVVEDKIELSFSRDVYPILQSKCSGCHAGAGFGSYKLSGVVASDYPTIKALVNTDSPAESKLLVKGITMALTAGSAEYETIKTWITQGAANN